MGQFQRVIGLYGWFLLFARREQQEDDTEQKNSVVVHVFLFFLVDQWGREIKKAVRRRPFDYFVNSNSNSSSAGGIHCPPEQAIYST